MKGSLNDQYRRSVSSEQMKFRFGGSIRDHTKGMFGSVKVQTDLPRKSAIDVSDRPRDLRPNALPQYGFSSGLVNGVFGYNRSG